MACRRSLLSQRHTTAELLYLEEAIVRGLVGVTSEEPNPVYLRSYKLTPVFSDGLDHSNECTWTSTNTNNVVVSVNGTITAPPVARVSNADLNYSTISCTFKGLTKTCLVSRVFSDSDNQAAASNARAYGGGHGENWNWPTGGWDVNTYFQCPDIGALLATLPSNVSYLPFVYDANAFIGSSARFWVPFNIRFADRNSYGMFVGARDSQYNAWYVQEMLPSGTYRTAVIEGTNFSYLENYATPISFLYLNGSTATLRQGDYDGYAQGSYNAPQTFTPASFIQAYDARTTSWQKVFGARSNPSSRPPATAEGTNSLMNYAQCEFLYNYACHIVLSDIPGRVGYVKIPNLGTTGDLASLVSTNAPRPEWFYGG